MVIGATLDANTTANTQAIASKHSTLANTQVTDKHSLERSKPAPLRPEPTGKKGCKRLNVFYDNQGFSDLSDLVDRHIHGVDGHRVVNIR